VVQPGDGWIRIARRALGDDNRWREIAQINGGEDRVFHPGDVITLPT
jgi:nucleoid-associated protein YgaU